METSKYTAFLETAQLAAGELTNVLLVVKAHLEATKSKMPLIIEDNTGKQVDFDLSGSPTEVVERYANPAPAKRRRGRPKLGVVSREISLLPRHWDWLQSHDTGVSATLRKLIDEARKRDPDGERQRLARAATASFLAVIAGDLPGYENATRALYAKDRDAFTDCISTWPEDVRNYALARWPAVED